MFKDFPKILIPFLVIGSFVFLVGAIFRIQHWPYAIILSGAGCGILALTLLVRLLFVQNRKFADYVLFLFVLFAGGYWIMLQMHLPMRLPVLIIATIALTVLLLTGKMSFFPFSLDFKSNRNKVLSVLSLLSATLVITGALFKIQHWPGAMVLLLTGIGLGAIRFIAELFRKE